LPYRLEYSPDAEDHLRALTPRQRAIILDAVDEQLAHQPMDETRNRKPMRPNPLAPWELRVGVLRVYYDPEDVPEQVVYIRAVGVKERNRVRIGGEVIEL
jgi:mRNA-degrading endonuclease RelE of RelBE toxin-antitoxin system